jgi:hypothetical protein
MKARHLLVTVLVVALLVLAVRPAPAEAVDPMVAIAIAGAAVAVVVLVVYLVVANVEGGRGADAGPATDEPPMLVVYVTPAQTPDAP